MDGFLYCLTLFNNVFTIYVLTPFEFLLRFDCYRREKESPTLFAFNEGILPRFTRQNDEESFNYVILNNEVVKNLMPKLPQLPLKAFYSSKLE